MPDTETAASTYTRTGPHGNGATTQRVRGDLDADVLAPGSAPPGEAGEWVAAADPATAARVTGSGAHLAYNPALDGIRGLAVAAVLLFHGGFSWARGGYLGVSTFFTLSGFLITSLLVAERRSTGRVRLTAFWARRLRRLFPASAATLALISLSALFTDQLWERELPGDVLSALAQVANWRFLLADRSYGELFSSPSPVLHFWSLAIEEQFYWMFPLVVAAVFGLTRGSLRALAAVLAAMLAGSAALTLALGPHRPTAIYYGTPVRMGEILVGALLAVVVCRGGLPGGRPARWAAAALGVVALAATVLAWWNIEQDSPRLYKGGLLIYALVSGALVLAATVPGPVRRLLALEPLRLLGVISYGVYLVHWPIFLVVDARGTGLDPWPLFGLRAAITLAVATASYVLLERPIRRGWRPRLAPMPALAGAAFASVAAIAVVVPAASEPPIDVNELLARGGGDPDPADVPADALIGLTIGDSTMFRTSWGLSVWGDDNGRMKLMPGAGGIGCGLTRGGLRRNMGEVGPTRPECDSWADLLPDAIDRRRERYGRVDFAFMQTGPWDVADRQLPGEDVWRAPGDPVYDAYLRSELSALTDLLLDRGVSVVWVTAPYIEVGKLQSPPPPEPYAESDPVRMDRLNEIIREITDARVGATMVDLNDYIDDLPTDEDERLRPDGVHFELATAVEVADWLGPQVMRALGSEPRPSVREDPGAPTPTTSTVPTTDTTLTTLGSP